MTSDLKRVQEWFATGRLVHPTAPGPNTVDLVRALYARCGAPLALSPAAGQLYEALGDARHYVFVLIDGLGPLSWRLAPAGGFLRRQRVGSLRPVFPSTTAAALTSFATGRSPGEHGVLGWWIFLPELQRSAVALQYCLRSGGQDLSEYGLSPQQVYPTPSLLGGLGEGAAHCLPEAYAFSTYSQYCSGPAETLPYARPEHAVELLVERLAHTGTRSPGYTWLYLPGMDHAAHRYGASSKAVERELARYDALLADLRRRTPGDCRIVVSADHGHQDTPDTTKRALEPADPLLDLLLDSPSGEPTVPLFHVRPGREEEFAAGFRARFGDQFALLAAAQVEELQLLGSEPLSAVARARLGQFLAISAGPGVLIDPAVGRGMQTFRSYHAGLSPLEMEVPLVLG